jgi:hypothetical protein
MEKSFNIKKYLLRGKQNGKRINNIDYGQRNDDGSSKYDSAKIRYLGDG